MKKLTPIQGQYVSAIFKRPKDVIFIQLQGCLYEIKKPNIQLNSVITNKYLGKICRFSTQMNPVITKPGY
jgi:hypothetical protein